MRRFHGFTLIEVLVSFGLFSGLSLLMVLAFVKGAEVWRRTSGGADAQLNLRKANAAIARDLQRTSFGSVRRAQGLSSLGAIDSDAFWFLSAIDPSSGTTLRKADGTPFWQRNILYYAVVPTDHAAKFGVNCSGGSDAAGYEVNCPHKVLIRKVIDSGPVTDPSDESTEEQVLTPNQAASYLTQPSGFDASAMSSEPGLGDIKLVSTFLLSLRCQLAPEATMKREVRFTMSSVKLSTAKRELSIGRTRLDDTRFARKLESSVFPALP